MNWQFQSALAIFESNIHQSVFERAVSVLSDVEITEISTLAFLKAPLNEN